MRKLRDPQGTFVKTGKLIEIPTNFHGGHNTPTTNLA